VVATPGSDASIRSEHPVVRLRGELDITTVTAALTALTAAAIRGQSIIVDLAELDFLDCSAVRALLVARVVARESGGDVTLRNSQGCALRLLTILGLGDGALAEPETMSQTCEPALGFAG
jgi:anti-anti-sigma factor